MSNVVTITTSNSGMPERPHDSQHIFAFDALRFLAAFGIVWFHLSNTPDRFIGYAGLPIFLLMSFSLQASKKRDYKFSVFCVHKAKKLLLPWLVWSIIYLPIYILKFYLDQEDFRSILSLVFSGPSIHLWYLIFAYIGSIVIWVIKKYLPSKASFQFIFAFVASLLGFILLVLQPIINRYIQWLPPFGQWNFGLPSIPLGVAMGIAINCQSKHYKILLLISIIAEVLIAAAICWRFQNYAIAIAYGLGSLSMWLCLTCVFPKSKFISYLSSLTLGIYLIHPLVAMIINYMTNHSLEIWSLILIVFVVSSIMTAFLKRTSFVRYVI